jgi:arylsulfatase A-like enzyme
VRLFLALVTLSALVSCQDPPAPEPLVSEPLVEQPPPNVIVVVLDTLRADHVGCYGYERPTTPVIDAFAAGSTRYARSLASAPWTLPSHASMLTGKHPFQHGAHSFEVERKVDDNVSPLADEQLTLAEYLGGHGYSTGAFLANEAFLARRYNLHQGFETYHLDHVKAVELNPLILSWVDEHRDAPFFLLVNYMDVHQPLNLTPRPGFLDAAAAEKSSGRLVRSIRNAVLPGEGPLPEAKLGRLVDMYDLALANLDEQVGLLLAGLDQRGLMDGSVVVLVSDHGGYFGEHHLLGHSKDVYHEAMEVPLILRHPGQDAGAVVDVPVTSADLPRLIFEGFPTPLEPEHPFMGSDSATGALGENYYARVKDLFGTAWDHRFDRVRRSLVQWPYKLIHSSDGEHELYDLAADPAEVHDLMAEQPDLASAMIAQVEQLIAAGSAAAGAAPSAPLTEAEKSKLRALGYMDEAEE